MNWFRIHSWPPFYPPISSAALLRELLVLDPKLNGSDEQVVQSVIIAAALENVARGEMDHITVSLSTTAKLIQSSSVCNLRSFVFVGAGGAMRHGSRGRRR
jgi:hypothetical protein